MITSFAAPHAKGKIAKDKIFGAAAAAKADIAKYGKELVVNGTQGCILDENGKLVCLPTIEKKFRELLITDIISYAPIAGLPEYLELVQTACFGTSRPQDYIAAIATTGGTGGIHHAIHNYTSVGDTVLTSQWYWAAYKNICLDNNRELETYTMLNAQETFNITDLDRKIRSLLIRQESVLLIINTPAHNPTGYSLSLQEMHDVVNVAAKCSKDTGKKVILFIDVAYLDYAGDKEEIRRVFTAFSNLPEGVLVIVEYSMSKSFTMYGQRVGAMIGISGNEQVIEEFKDINTYTSRATWSNINRACMQLLVNVYSNIDILKQVEKERAFFYKMTKARADVFMKEAKECNLKIIPYKAGFFISIPSKQPDAVCEKLHDDHVFIVPLAAGIRVAVCAIPLKQMSGLAEKIKKALVSIEG